MKAVWLVAKSELRRRWRTVFALIVIAGAGSAFAVTAGVGARRAWTAWDRLGAATLAPNGVYTLPPDAADKLDLIPRMPGVEAVGTFSFVPIAPAPLDPGSDAAGFVATDPQFGQTIFRSLVVEGRHADPRRADEVTVNERWRPRACVSANACG